MRSKAILILAVALCALVSTADGATITWADHGATPARDSFGNPLQGQSTFGTPNLTRGALVQLWLAVGTVDDPFAPGNAAAFTSTDWKVDDVLLQESHIGHGTFVSNAGTWSTRSDFAVNEGDTLYVRAYNLPKADWAAAGTRQLGIKNSQDAIVTQLVGDVRNPQTLYFDDLKTQPIPEPATLLLLAPGLALWAIRRKK